MYDKQSLECNLIVDDDFMDKDVSELVQEDYSYLTPKDQLNLTTL